MNDTHPQGQQLRRKAMSEYTTEDDYVEVVPDSELVIQPPADPGVEGTYGLEEEA